MYIQKNIERIVSLIVETFNRPEDKDALSIALHMLEREVVVSMAHMAIDLGNKEVPNMMPEVVLKMINSKNDLVNNEFYVKHFAAIEVAMQRVSFTIASKAFYLSKWHKNNDERARDIAQSMASTFSSGITDIVYLARGAEIAQIFDIKLRLLSYTEVNNA